MSTALQLRAMGGPRLPPGNQRANESMKMRGEPMTTQVIVQPVDEHNHKLVSHVHPPDWINPTPAGRYNMVVIGAGTAGLVTAAGAAGLGAKVALIERYLMGGDCLNVGCVPSKALIRAARAVADVRAAAELSIEVPAGVKIRFPAIMERMRRLRAHIAENDSAERFKSLGVDVFLGEAKFTGPRTVEVDGKTLRFAKACIATGGRAAAAPIPGIGEVGYLTNETIFSLTELPKRFAVIGAGPIGCEMAQTFARFGSEVYLIEAMHGILPREDPEAAAIIKRVLLREGIQIMCCGKQVTVSKVPGGKRLTLDSHEGHYDLVADEILLAVGRVPNIEGLGLAAAGVEHEKFGVSVNDRLQTTNPRIYAAGDICSKYKFTHAADALARIVIQNALFGFLPVKAKASALTMPWCTFTVPEIAHVGMYPNELEERGIAYDTFNLDLDNVDRAILDGETNGLLKIHVKKGTDRILGATLVAHHAGEMISEVTLGMVNKIGLKGYSSTIHPYPTQAEVFRKVGDAFNRSRLTPRRKKILEKLMAWQL